MNPNQIILEIKPTFACTSQCKFCCFRNKEKGAMEFDEIKKNIAYLKKEFKSIDLVILSGGEPTVLNYFWELLALLKQELSPKEFVIHTNGHFFADKENVKRIKEYNPVIQISFHTLNKNFFKKYISPDLLLEDISEAIGNFKEYFITFHANVLIFNNNLYELENITSFLCKNKVSQIEFRLPYSLNLKEHSSLIIKDFEVVREKLKQIMLDFYQKTKFAIHPGFLCLMGDPSLREFIVKISVAGRYLFIDKSHQLGDLNNTSLQISSADSESRDRFYMPKRCSKCKDSPICLGIPIEFKTQE
jgi:MoaA/NifB/PqqE/SkfB family radical SAM enzyme